VRVIGQALRAVRREHLERVHQAPPCADPGLAACPQVAPALDVAAVGLDDFDAGVLVIGAVISPNQPMAPFALILAAP